jgi:hypothetical protein
MLHTPRLRALRVAALSPLQGATPADRFSRIRGVFGVSRARRELYINPNAQSVKSHPCSNKELSNP